jgi:alpha-1,2-mannosyltransferase
MSTLIALSLGSAVGIFAFAAGAALVGSWLVAVPIALAAFVVTARAAWKRPIVAIDPAACSRGLTIVSGLATIVALVQLFRLSVFMVAPSHTGFSTIPMSERECRHSCLSAYFVAAGAAGEAPNVYDTALYFEPATDPSPSRPKRIGYFNVDPYEYPPTFLLLPRALKRLVPDFLRHRMLWFALSGGLVLLAMLVVVRSLAQPARTRALLLMPLVWTAIPTLNMFQKGNFQAVAFALAMLAMALFQRRRPAAGGALLAFAIASKLFPGLLVVYLIARREWRALAWTAAWGVAFVLAAIADVGWAVFAAFLAHLPALVGGEAFPAFRRAPPVAINISIPGLVFKLKLFGVPGMGFAAMKIVGWAYTVAAVWVTVRAGLRRLAPGDEPLVWLAILILASLRSPFLPQAYGLFPPIWLLTLLAASHAPTARTLAPVLLAWAALNIFWPIDWPIDPRLLAAVNAVPQAVTIAVAILALRAVWRRARPADLPPVTVLR